MTCCYLLSKMSFAIVDDSTETVKESTMTCFDLLSKTSFAIGDDSTETVKDFTMVAKDSKLKPKESQNAFLPFPTFFVCFVRARRWVRGAGRLIRVTGRRRMTPNLNAFLQTVGKALPDRPSADFGVDGDVELGNGSRPAPIPKFPGSLLTFAGLAAQLDLHIGPLESFVLASPIRVNPLEIDPPILRLVESPGPSSTNGRSVPLADDVQDFRSILAFDGQQVVDRNLFQQRFPTNTSIFVLLLGD